LSSNSQFINLKFQDTWDPFSSTIVNELVIQFILLKAQRHSEWLSSLVLCVPPAKLHT